eukprot:GFUD01103045.1.p1 GENE.GFUD01103045.1~~GFUD01103045.1.p1  ORF type:complete len:122 (+),score=31.68 GFUD01103045.1:42-407(+)
MKLKLSLSKIKKSCLDRDEQKEIRGTPGKYKLMEKSAPLAEEENYAEFRNFPDFDFLLVPGNRQCLIFDDSVIQNLPCLQESHTAPQSSDQSPVTSHHLFSAGQMVMTDATAVPPVLYNKP